MLSTLREHRDACTGLGATGGGRLDLRAERFGSRALAIDLEPGDQLVPRERLEQRGLANRGVTLDAGTPLVGGGRSRLCLRLRDLLLGIDRIELGHDRALRDRVADPDVHRADPARVERRDVGGVGDELARIAAALGEVCAGDRDGRDRCDLRATGGLVGGRVLAAQEERRDHGDAGERDEDPGEGRTLHGRELCPRVPRTCARFTVLHDQFLPLGHSCRVASMVPARIALLVLALVAAATDVPLAAPADPPTAPAEPPVLLPWKIGQSVTYEVTDKQQTKTVTLRVVAEDACGFWLDVDNGDQTLRMCVTRAPLLEVHTLVVRKDGLTTAVTDGPPADASTVAPLLELLTADWNGRRGMPREDVTTPATTFPAALKEVNGGRTRWSHPAVPLGGVVRETEGDVSTILVDFALTGGSSVIGADQRRLHFHGEQERTRSRMQRLWLGISLGNDLLGTIDDHAWTESFGFGFGYKLTRSVALFADTMRTGYAPYPDDPVLAEVLLQARVGVRYFPLAGSTGRWSPLTQPIYLQADVGYAQLDRGTVLMGESTVGRGVVGGARLGTSSGFARDWRVAIELHQHTALLNGDEGVRVVYGLNGVFELYFR